MEQDYQKFSFQELTNFSTKEIAKIEFYHKQTPYDKTISQISIKDSLPKIRDIYYNNQTKTIYIPTYLFINEPKTFYNIVSLCYQNTTSQTIYIENNTFFRDSWEKILNNPHISTIYYNLYEPSFLTAEKLRQLKAKSKTIYVKEFSPHLFPRLNKDFFLSQTFHDPGYPYDIGTAILSNPILEEEFSYLQNTTDIIISYYHETNLKAMLDYLTKINYQGTITIKASSAGQDYLFLKNYQETLHLTIQESYLDKANLNYKPTEEEFFKTTANLQELIIPIKNSSLSPFEKYIFLYDLVKNYKIYKENLLDVYDARSIYRILDNEFMVCAGYANLLTNLCELVGIPCEYIGCAVGNYQSWKDNELLETALKKFPSITHKFLVRFQKLFNKFQDLTTKYKLVTPKLTKSYHARCYVYLKDPKYQINGFYYSDPTFENHRDFNYTFLAFTDHENSLSKETWYMDAMALQDCQTKEEFYEKLNHLQKQNPNKTLLGVINPIINILKKFEPQWYETLENTYPLVFQNRTYMYGYDKEVNSLLDDLYDYISKKTNHPIPEETMIEAILQVKNYEYKDWAKKDTITYKNALKIVLSQNKDDNFYKDAETKKHHTL